MTTKPNPELFIEMNQPFDSSETAKTALGAFITDVMVAREKHKVTNVLLTMQVPTLCEGGGSGDLAVSFLLGDSEKGERMAAIAYGEMKKTRDIRMAKLLKNGVPSGEDDEE